MDPNVTHKHERHKKIESLETYNLMGGFSRVIPQKNIGNVRKQCGTRYLGT